MEKQDVVIGLDSGTGSVGFCACTRTGNSVPFTRTYPAGGMEFDGKHKSKAALRSAKIADARRRDRKQVSLEILEELLGVDHSIFNDISKKSLDGRAAAVQALVHGKTLSFKEFVRAVLWERGHRGAKGLLKVDARSDDLGVVKKSIQAIDEEMSKTKSRTRLEVFEKRNLEVIKRSNSFDPSTETQFTTEADGPMIHGLFPLNEGAKGKNTHFSRDHVMTEVSLLIEMHRDVPGFEVLNKSVSDIQRDFIERSGMPGMPVEVFTLADLILAHIWRQEPLSGKTPGRCSLVKTEFRARKASFEHNEFHVEQFIRDIRVEDRSGARKGLSQKAIEKLIGFLCLGERNFTDIKAFLKREGLLAKGEKVKRGEESESRTECHWLEMGVRALSVSIGFTFPDETRKKNFLKTVSDNALEVSDVTDPKMITDAATKIVDDSDGVVSQDQAEEICRKIWGTMIDPSSGKEFVLPEGFGKYGKKACNSLLQAYEDLGSVGDGKTFHTIVDARNKAGFENPWDRKGLGLRQIRVIYPSSTSPDPSKVVEVELTGNHVVARTLSQNRRTLNDFLKANPNLNVVAIICETAREIGMSMSALDAHKNEQFENEKTNKAISAELLKAGLKDTKTNINKVKLWRELGAEGDRISLFAPFGDLKGNLSIQDAIGMSIGHIVPRTHGFTDTMFNWTLIGSTTNAIMGENTPYNAFNSDPAAWDQFVSRIEALKRSKKIPEAKADLLMSSVLPDPIDWAARSLNDTREVSMAVVEMLRDICPKDKLLRNFVFFVPGHLTAKVRNGKIWSEALAKNGLKPTVIHKTKNRSDERHHAIDAAVMASMWNWSGSWSERLHAIHTANPRDIDKIGIDPVFVDQAAKSISEMTCLPGINGSASIGRLHEDNPLRVEYTRKGPVYSKHAPLTDLIPKSGTNTEKLAKTIKEIESIMDKQLQSELLKIVHRPDFNNRPAAFFNGVKVRGKIHKRYPASYEESQVVIFKGKPFIKRADGSNHQVTLTFGGNPSFSSIAEVALLRKRTGKDFKVDEDSSTVIRKGQLVFFEDIWYKILSFSSSDGGSIMMCPHNINLGGLTESEKKALGRRKLKGKTIVRLLTAARESVELFSIMKITQLKF